MPWGDSIRPKSWIRGSGADKANEHKTRRGSYNHRFLRLDATESNLWSYILTRRIHVFMKLTVLSWSQFQLSTKQTRESPQRWVSHTTTPVRSSQRWVDHNATPVFSALDTMYFRTCVEYKTPGLQAQVKISELQVSSSKPRIQPARQPASNATPSFNCRSPRLGVFWHHANPGDPIALGISHYFIQESPQRWVF